MLHILEELGFNENAIDVVTAFDEMTSKMESNFYTLIFFGLKMFENNTGVSIQEILQKKKDCSFLIFCERMDIEQQRKMYRTGVKGILNKNASKAEIVFAIQKVLDKKIYINVEYAVKLFLLENNTKNRNQILTEREKQVAELLAQGKNNNYISNILNIMPTTVSTFKTRIFNKLKVRNIIELKEWENCNKVYL